MSELNLAERLAKYSTPTLAEASSHVVVLPPVIAPLFRPIQLSGPVYLVLAMPGDNLAVHLALAKAPGGSVLVVATGPELQKGFWGEIMTEAALARKIRGLVTDGAVRDTRPIRESAFPVFCAGVAISGTTKISPRGWMITPGGLHGTRSQKPTRNTQELDPTGVHSHRGAKPFPRKPKQ